MVDNIRVRVSTPLPKIRVRVLPSLLPTQIELRNTGTEIQWRYIDGVSDWSDLIGISDIAATVTIGTVTTLPGGSAATVVNVGTDQDVILDFGLPTGGVSSVNGATGVVVLSAADIASTPAGSLSSSTVQAALNELAAEKIGGGETIKTSAYTALAADSGKTIILNKATADTLSFSAAASLGSAWMVLVKNIGVGIWTLDPNGSETIEGVATVQIGSGESAIISCNGSAFRRFMASANYDNTGRLLLGMASSVTNGDAQYTNIQNAGTTNGATGGAEGLFQFSNDASCSFLGFFKTRATTKGQFNVAVQSADDLGEVNFAGSDGTNFVKAGYITGYVNGSVSAGVVPMAVLWGTMNAAGVLAERMRLTAEGKLLIGTTTPGTEALTVNGGAKATNLVSPLVNGGASASSSLILASTSGSGTTDYIALQTGSQVEAARIDTNGKLLTGLTSAIVSGTAQYLSVENAGTNHLGLNGGNHGLFQFSNDASCSFLGFYKTRSTSKGTFAGAVQANDDLGEINWNGSDGTNFVDAGWYTPNVDGAVSAGIVPMRHSWGTMSTAGVYGERMRLTANGSLVVAGTTAGASYSPTFKLEVNGSAGVQNLSITGSGAVAEGLSRPSAGTMDAYSGGVKALRLFGTATNVNYLSVAAADTGSAIGFAAQGTDTDVGFYFSTRGAGNIQFDTGGGSFLEQLRILHTAGATRYMTLTGSNGGNPTIGVSAGSLGVTPDVVAAASVKSNSASAGIGYATGAGGTVAQATSKATGVTLNKIAGQVTMQAAALAAAAKVSFVVTDSAVAATDIIIVNIVSGGTANAYRANVTAVAAGSFTVTVENITAGSLSESPVVGFAVIKAVTA